MLRAVFFNEGFGTHERFEIEVCPRIGELVTLFYHPFPKVVGVCWMFGDANFHGFSGENTDVIILVD